MQRSLRFIAAASLAVAGVAFSTPASAADQPQAGQQGSPQASPSPKSDQGGQGSRSDQANPGGQIIYRHVVIYGALVPEGQAQQPQGFSQIHLKDGPAIRQAISSVTDAVLDNNSSTHLLDNLSAKDRQRLGNGFKLDGQPLKDAVSQIQKSWKDQYHSDFNPQQELASFGKGFTIVEGAVSDPKLLSNWPVPQQQQGTEAKGQSQGTATDQNQGSGQHSTAGQPRSSADPQASSGQGARSPNQETTGTPGQSAQTGAPGKADQSGQGEQFAVIVFPQSAQLPETRVSLLKEGGAWKVELPDNVDGKALEQSLSKALQQCAGANGLPQDQKLAYQQISHAIFMGLYDQSASSPQRNAGGNANRGNAAQSGQK